MASITIRNLDDDVKTRLRVRAAEHSRSMEEEARIILRDAVSRGKPRYRNLTAFTRECFAPLGGVELELPPRGPMREPPDFPEQRPRMYVIDTNVASELMRPEPTASVAAWIAQRDSDYGVAIVPAGRRRCSQNCTLPQTSATP